VQVGQRLGQGKRTLARRIHQPFVAWPSATSISGRHLEQVARYKFCSYQRFMGGR
jgi:hypothetical protein